MIVVVFGGRFVDYIRLLIVVVLGGRFVDYIRLLIVVILGGRFVDYIRWVDSCLLVLSRLAMCRLGWQSL